MREPTEKEIHIISLLLYLFDLTSRNYPDWDGDQVKEFIDVGEWGQAADLLAFHYLPQNFNLTASVFTIFCDLAEYMRLLQKKDFPSIKLLLENPPHENVHSK